MNKFSILSLIVVCLSCKRSERIFFKNLKAENYFLDTFSLLNLKGFGLSTKPIKGKNITYYDFNKNNNSIQVSGAFYKKQGDLFFLPEGSDKGIMFFEPSMWDSNLRFFPQTIITKYKSLYEISRMGLMYNNEINDSTLNIEIRMSAMLRGTEFLIFEITKSLDVLKIVHVNCKNDTLIMKLFPKNEVFYLKLNTSTRCI